jgi:hypothetical protein
LKRIYSAKYWYFVKMAVNNRRNMQEWCTAHVQVKSVSNKLTDFVTHLCKVQVNSAVNKCHLVSVGVGGCGSRSEF